MIVRRWWTSVRDSLWFIPSLFVVASAGLAFAVLALDRAASDVVDRFPLAFGGGADGARGLLSSIAGSMITVAGVTFSITVVVLQLASSQFSPRVLRTFMRDRASQLVLGTFIGAFTFAMLILRAVRGEGGGEAAFVPAFGVTVAMLYALAALGMLVYYIHHIASSIQVSTMASTIASEALGEIHAHWPEREPADGSEPDAVPAPAGPPGSVRSSSSGYLQLIDTEGLVALAAERQAVVRLTAARGAWVLEGSPIAEVWPSAAAGLELADGVNACVTLGGERTIEEDAAFGIRQLVDIAVKAISPGVNDPTTAAECLDRIGQVLAAAGSRQQPDVVARDDDGQVRLIASRHGWLDLTALAFDQLRQYGAANADVALAVTTTLERLISVVPADRRDPLVEQARRIGQVASTIAVSEDRQRVLAAVSKAVHAGR